MSELDISKIINHIESRLNEGWAKSLEDTTPRLFGRYEESSVIASRREDFIVFKLEPLSILLFRQNNEAIYPLRLFRADAAANIGFLIASVELLTVAPGSSLTEIKKDVSTVYLLPDAKESLIITSKYDHLPDPLELEFTPKTLKVKKDKYLLAVMIPKYKKHAIISPPANKGAVKFLALSG